MTSVPSSIERYRFGGAEREKRMYVKTLRPGIFAFTREGFTIAALMKCSDEAVTAANARDAEQCRLLDFQQLDIKDE